jgi:tungstate transport system ATP-binding protein
MSAPVYQLNGVKQRYGKRTTLHIESLAVQPGEVLAVVGPSGAGKSTLLRLLALLEAPTSGSLTLHLNGEDVPALAAPIDVRRQVTLVFQRPFLLSRSVYRNVAYGLNIRGKHDKDAVMRALERVALAHLAQAHAGKLSGGEMQRVAVARALVTQPRVLLLDEATANLDPYNVRIIENLIREQNEQFGTTIVLVTHNIFQAQRLAQRVGLLLDGQLIEIAATQAFFDAPRDPRTQKFISGDLIY